MNSRTTFVGLAMVAICTSAFAQTGQIAGRVIDVSGSALPGVRVTVDGPGLHEQAITDADGRFAVQRFLTPAPSTYRIVAELPGFETAIMTVSAGIGVNTPVNIPMRVGCLTILDEVVPEMHETIDDADLVALVRLDSIEFREKVRFDDSYCGDVTTFNATVLETVKDRNSQRPVSSVRFVMLHRSDVERGDDYIAFLKWQPRARVYLLMSRSYFVPVRGGLVEWPSPDLYGVVRSGPVMEVLAALRSISGQP